MLKLKYSVRGQFLVIALSLYFMMTILGLSAFLNKNVSSSISFKVMTNDDLNIELNYNKQETDPYLVVPGEKVNLNLKVKNKSQFPVYIFAKFEGNEIIDFNDENVSKFANGQLEKLDNPSKCIYYYGSDSVLTELSKNSSAELLEHIKISEDATGKVGEFLVTVYAIQSAGFENNDTPSTPESVWQNIAQQG